jgi:hypothetical protein
MKTDLRTLIVVAIVSVGTFLTTASAQTDATARKSVAKETYEGAIDVRPQYEAALKQKRDGKFLLYTDEDGTKLFLPVKGGQPGPPIAVGKGGGPVATTSTSSGAGECLICWDRRRHCIRIKCRFE